MFKIYDVLRQSTFWIQFQIYIILQRHQLCFGLRCLFFEIDFFSNKFGCVTKSMQNTFHGLTFIPYELKTFCRMIGLCYNWQTSLQRPTNSYWPSPSVLGQLMRLDLQMSKLLKFKKKFKTMCRSRTGQYHQRDWTWKCQNVTIRPRKDWWSGLRKFSWIFTKRWQIHTGRMRTQLIHIYMH